MNQGEKNTTYRGLLAQLELVCRREMKTPRDFDWLSDEMRTKRGETVSSNTLKRLWGYLPTNVKPREYTLDCLSRFIGYRDYAHFVEQGRALANEESSSEAVVSKKLNVSQDLAVRDRILLTWNPGRMCTVRHLGKDLFVVENSERTRLQAGNTFRCGLIIEGEPLYIDDLVQEGRMPVAYVCGKVDGIHFEVIKASEIENQCDE
ncbi:MAG: hypothetical protein IJV05_10895 [Muribaculaceae bacterium]|nr:hypothetical protein [Muribaculaceae bacterium]